jgi:hypothetical protein
MTEDQEIKMIEDVGFIKGKMEIFISLQEQTQKNTTSISRLNGVFGALTIFVGLVFPLMGNYFVSRK